MPEDRERQPLTDLRPGSTFRLTGRLVSTASGGAETEFVREDGTVAGTLSVAADGSLSGQLTEAALVEPLAVAIEIGDVMEHLDTGETVVVRATGLGPHGRQFSNAANADRARTYDPERWQHLGHFDLP